jgi:predicted nucleic acid-binding protein
MNVVDSSGWLEFFTAGPNGPVFKPVILDTDILVVPSITLFEVFKRLLRDSGEKNALRAIGLMRRGLVVDLDADLALAAAKLSHDLKLPMADSIILATARAHDATLWTQDDDFEGIPGVRYFSK